MNQFFIMGLVGLIAVLSGNVISLALGQNEAAFLTRGWWSAWFTHYIVWIVFLVIGLAQQVRTKSPA